MTTILLIIHLVVTLALIGVVLIQRSEGGGLGVGTTQGMGSFMSGRGTANLLTRTTAILAAAFMALSLTLALLNRGTTLENGRSSILDAAPTPAIPAPAALAPVPAVPSTSPAEPAPAIAPTIQAEPAPAEPVPSATAPVAPAPAPAPADPAPADAVPAAPAPADQR